MRMRASTKTRRSFACWAGQLPELKNVVNTPRAEIGFQLLQGGRRAVIVSVIDNLLKGAASQAVQNFNRMCGFAETEALV